MWTLEWWWRFFVLSIILYKRISCCWSWINKKGSEEIELCNELHTISADRISFPWHPLFNELATFETLPRRRKMDKLADLISVKIERDGLSRVCVPPALRRRRLLIIEDIRRFICSGAIKLYAFFFSEQDGLKIYGPKTPVVDWGRICCHVCDVWLVPLSTSVSGIFFRQINQISCCLTLGRFSSPFIFYFFSLCPYRRLCTNLDNARTHCSMRTSSETKFLDRVAWRLVNWLRRKFQ